MTYAKLLLFSAACTAVFAQAPTAQPPKLATDIKAAEIQAVVAFPNLGTDRQIKVVDIGTHNVAVGVLRRGKTPAGGRISAVNHAEVTEVYYVVSGSGVLVTGGVMENERPMDPRGEIVRDAVGPSNTATFKEPAQQRRVETGDMIVIPAGVYHGFTDIPDHIEYVAVRSDPKHVLPAGYISPALKK